MKKFGVLIFATALIAGLLLANASSFGRAGSGLFNFSFNSKGVKGSGNAAKENREVSGFKAVDAGGVFQVEISAQKEFSVEIEADDNLLPLIKTEVRKGVLHIDTDKRVSASIPMRVFISMPVIEGIDASGASNFDINNLNSPQLNIDSSGASKISVTGETENLIVDVSGATKIFAEALTAINGEIKASGASQVTVNVTGDLQTSASGASNIQYVGTPANIKNSIRGAASVSPKK